MPFFARLASRFSGNGSLTWSATSDDSACPTSRQLYELSTLTFKSSACAEICGVLEKRLKQGPRAWRNTTKSLAVCKHLLIHGSPQMAQWAAANSALFQQLQANRIAKPDHSALVRDLSGQVQELATSPEKRAAEKQAYERTRQQVRTSIGRNSTSRSTLDIVRNLDDGVPERAPAPGPGRRSDVGPGRMSLSAELGAIQEEGEARV